MNPTRRALLVTLLAGTALAACTSTGAPTVVPATVISTAQSIVNGLAGAAALPAVAAAINAVKGGPALLATITSDLTLAQGALTALTANTPATTGASTAQQIDGWINTVIDTASSPPLIGLIPAPFSDAVEAAAVLLPPIEAFINQYLPASMTGVAAAAAPHHAAAIRAKSTLTAAQAQNTLARFR